ncbi:Pyruvate/Phosphoenolpyruvate kinase-like domain-containing protein [Aspergillus venezuelensis]
MSTNGTANCVQPLQPLPPGNRLRQLLDEKDIIVAPGVYDGFSARIALEVGFDNLYMTGAGTSASRLGQPDFGFASLNDIREHAEMIANLNPAIPLLADADTGCGGPNMVARAVAQYHRSGAAGLHIEDQIQTKRYGHLGDALQAHGFDEAVLRLKAAIAAGADVAFLEGVTNEEARDVCRLLAPTPVLLNKVENGATPSWSPEKAKELGFRIIIFPFAAIAPAYEAIRSTYRSIKKSGVTEIDLDFTPKKLFTIVSLEEAITVDVAAGGDLYGKV